MKTHIIDNCSISDHNDDKRDSAQTTDWTWSWIHHSKHHQYTGMCTSQPLDSVMKIEWIWETHGKLLPTNAQLLHDKKHTKTALINQKFTIQLLLHSHHSQQGLDTYLLIISEWLEGSNLLISTLGVLKAHACKEGRPSTCYVTIGKKSIQLWDTRYPIGLRITRDLLAGYPCYVNLNRLLKEELTQGAMLTQLNWHCMPRLQNLLYRVYWACSLCKHFA